MNFASILKHHQSKPATSLLGNQFLINCNLKNQNPQTWKTHNNNFSGIKRKAIDSICPKLFEIYQTFQDDQHVQCILQMQGGRIRFHKFKPSKIKNKKSQSILHQHAQQVKPTTNKKYINLNINQEEQESFQNHFPHQQNNYPYQQNNSHHSEISVKRKNYSPMQKLKPKTFGNSQNWQQNINKNKFSFGDQSQLHEQKHQQFNQFNNHPNPNSNNFKANHQENYQDYQQDFRYNNQQENNLRVDQFTQRQMISDQKRQERSEEPMGINLMNQFEKCTQKLQQTTNKNIDNQSDKIIRYQNHFQPESIRRMVKCSDGDPDSVIDFNLDVGFSFQQFQKIQSNHKNPKQTQITSIKIVQEKSLPKSNKDISQIDQFIVSPSSYYPKYEQKLPQHQQTSLKIIKINQKTNQKQNIQTNLQLNTKESSPHRILCKATLRNLTPQKFKYPRIQSKLQINSGVKQFSLTQITGAKTQNKILSDLQPQNVQSKKQLTSSKKLSALIEQSNKILANKHTLNNQPHLDRITRIVLHQGTQSEISKNQSQKINTNPVPQINIKSPPLKQKQQHKQIQLKRENEPKQFTTQNLTGPKSPVQQKPKFHNQLANMQTNYTPQKRSQTKYQKTPQKTAENKQLQNKTSVSPYIRYTESNTNQISSNYKNGEIVQNNCIQPSYAYKPLGIPIGPTITNPIYQPIHNHNQNNTNIYGAMTYQASQTNRQQVKPQTQPFRIYPSEGASIKTYSPYFPVTNNTVKNDVTSNTRNEAKPIPVYQTYNYSGSNIPASYNSNLTTNTQHNGNTQINNYPQPLGIQNRIQPSYLLSKEPSSNNYIKINTNYVSPLDKTDNQTSYPLNYGTAQKQNVKPTNNGIYNNFGWEEIKCVQSKIYDPLPNGIDRTIHSDPKQSSIQFSLRIDDHFHLTGK